MIASGQIGDFIRDFSELVSDFTTDFPDPKAPDQIQLVDIQQLLQSEMLLTIKKRVKSISFIIISLQINNLHLYRMLLGTDSANVHGDRNIPVLRKSPEASTKVMSWTTKEPFRHDVCRPEHSRGDRLKDMVMVPDVI